MEGLEADSLAGRRALVTGGGSGIGAQVVRDLAALGAAVLVAGRNEARLKEVAASVPDGAPVVVDLADRADVDRATGRILAEYGRIDILVSNAGWEKVARFVDTDPAEWDRLLTVNLRAPMQLTHALLPGMIGNGWGRAVFVSSDAARVGSSGEAVYAAAKAGLGGFAKTIARENARHGVTSNVVCPGPTDTPLLAEVAADNERLVAALERRIPARRLGRPGDVAGMVAFLASARAEFVTGQTISVSGGLTMV